MNMRRSVPVERYALYGEAHGGVELRFLHSERISLRSGQHNWAIAPHAHADLHQILFVTTGGGIMLAESERYEIAPPALLVIPATVVHGFQFHPGTDGHVITVARELIGEAMRGERLIDQLLRHPRCINHLGTRDVTAFSGMFEELAQEFVWSAPARERMIEANLTRILVAAGRLAEDRREATGRSGGADGLLLERYRTLIEQAFRTGLSVRDYASKLGVSEDRLLAVCRRRLGEPPRALIQRRIMIEAQRWLLYTAMSVSEISYALGFRDPAYFSRFFSRHAGRSPVAFRQAR